MSLMNLLNQFRYFIHTCEKNFGTIKALYYSVYLDFKTEQNV